VPWGCDDLQTYGVDCEDPDTKDLVDYPEITDQQPFLLVDGIRCSTLSSLPEFMDARLAHNLDVYASAAFAQELLTGAASGGHSLEGDADSLAAAGDLVSAIAALEDSLAGALHGGMGLLHMSPGTLAAVAAAGLAVFTDGQWKTPSGHTIVADAGYAADELSDTVTIYATGPVFYAISETQGVGSRNQESTDLERNIHLFLGERYGIVVFDPCAVFGIDTPLASAGGEGGGGDASAANQVTGNTRLQEIEDRIEALVTATGDLDANLEAIEVLITAGNASLADLQDALTADAATLSNVASQDTNINLLASAGTRRGVIIHNDDTGVLYVKYGSTASTTSYTVKIPVDGYWEMPGPIYTGAIDGIWVTSGSGSARITELT
jgi:hypothetical protein